MPVTMPGLGSGIETDKIVEKLKAAEEIPIKNYEEQIVDIKVQNKVLEELQKKSLTLEKKLKALYDYQSPFENKVLVPSANGYIESVANKDAEPGEHKLAINTIATKLKIHSDEIKDKVLPASTININGKETLFKGGSLEDFNSFLNQNYTKILTSSIARKNSKGSILIIESNTIGKEGLLLFKDSNHFLEDLGLIQSPSPEKQNNEMKSEQKNESLPLSFSEEKLTILKSGEYILGQDKQTLRLKETTTVRIDNLEKIPAEAMIKELQLRITEKKNNSTEEELDPGPYSVELGPVENVNIKGISLNSYNIQRAREKPEDAPVILSDYGIILPGDKKISLKNSGNDISIPLKEFPSYIDFYTNNTDIIFISPLVIYTIEQKKKPEEKPEEVAKENEQEKLFPHLITPAENANLTLDGVALEREKNNDLKDIFKGVTLNLIKSTGEDEIEVTITGDTEKSVEAVQDFIVAYNELLEFSREASATVKTEKAGEYNKKKSETGPLIGSSMVRSLINGLRIKVSSAYPAFREPYIKISQAIGIHTGEAGSDWESVSKGLLQMNEDKFREMVLAHPKAVKEFFGVDSNGDNLPDDGMAFSTVEFLKPYNQSGRGIISSTIKSNTEKIDSINKQIAKKREHIDHYTENLNKKFSHMESVIRQQKSTGDYLKQRFKQSE